MDEERSATPERQPADPPPPPPSTSAPPGPAAPEADEPDTDRLPVERPPEEATAQVRWSAAAPVPPPAPSKRDRRQREPKRVDATLDLPLDERVPPPGTRTESLSPDDTPPPPVDPWADAAPAWGPAALPPGPLAWQPAPQPPPGVPALPPAPPLPAGPAPVLPAPRPAGPPLTSPPRQRPPRKERRQPAPRQRQAPPGWGVPPGYELRRRKRRWPRRLTYLLLTFGCCCACPGYFLGPMWQQYPATAAIPAEVAGLTLRDDAESKRIVRELETEARTHNWLAEDTFAAVYDGGPGWRVTVYGTTGFRLAPKSDLDAEFNRLADSRHLTDVRDVDAGPDGGYGRCGVGATKEDDFVLCAWADHGSLGVATFSAGSMERSAETLQNLRQAIVSRG
jgi:hypothetical protein